MKYFLKFLLKTAVELSIKGSQPKLRFQFAVNCT